MGSKYSKYAVVAVLMGLLLGLPSFSSAQSVSDLQAQIQSLLRQVEALKAKLAATQNGSAIPVFCHSFDKRNFGVGASGEDVSALVSILVKEGVMAERDSNFGAEFDESLASAVSAFQEKYRSEVLHPVGLKNGTGYVGRATRAKLNALYGCSGGSSSDVVKKLQPIMPKKPATDAMMNVIAPNGGETLHKGTTYAITWHSPAPAASANISLVPYAAPCTASPCPLAPYYAPYTIQSSAPNNGVYHWSVGTVADDGMKTIPDGAYTMRICRTVPVTDQAGNFGAMACDESDSYFKITSTSGSDLNTAPIINSATAASSVQPGQSVNFSWGAIDPNNDDLSWSVDWGDGSGMAGSCQVNPPGGGTGQNRNYSASHAWANAGTYYAKVTVIDCKGGTGTYSFTVSVGSSGIPKNQPPVVTGVSGPTNLQVNQVGTWTVSAYDPEGGVLSYTVDWGDSGIAAIPQTQSAVPSQTATFTHSYAQAGSYTAKFTVTDNGGLTAQSSITVAVGSTTTQPSITVTKNPTVGTQTYPAGAANARIGSYVFTASSAEGVMISNLTIKMGAAGNQFQNLKVKIGSTQFGGTIPSLGANASYTLTGSPFTIPAGTTVVVDVYADVLSSATVGTKPVITTLAGCTGNGVISIIMVTCNTTPGQDVVIASSAMLTLSIGSTTPPARQLAMGTSGNTLAVYHLTETSNIEDVKVTDLMISDLVNPASAKVSFQNLSFYSATGVYLGSTSVGWPTSGGYSYQFHFVTPMIVPKSNTVMLTLKGDVGTYSSSSTTSNSSHVFGITGVTALGATSNSPAGITLGNVSANPMTVLRTVLTASAAPLGVTSGRSKNSVDDIGTLTFKADPAGALALNVVTVTFAGTAPANAAFLDSVMLYDPATASSIGIANTTSSACNGSNTCTKTFNLGAGVTGYVIGGGSSKTFNVRIDSTKTFSAPSGVSATLSATIVGANDVLYTDALDGVGTSNIPLPSSAVPMMINSVSFAQGT